MIRVRGGETGADPGSREGGSKNYIHNGGGYGRACPSHRGSGPLFLFTCSMKMNVLLTVVLFKLTKYNLSLAILKKGE